MQPRPKHPRFTFLPHLIGLALASGLAARPGLAAEGPFIAPALPAAELVAKVPAGLLLSEGPVTVSIRLVEPSVAEASGKGAKKGLSKLNGSQQRQLSSNLRSRQDGVLGAVRAVGGTEHARLTKALNAVVVTVDASALAKLATRPDVLSIRKIANYELHLSETVPYIGAAAAQGAGVDGSGVKVAVLDSGIDYTHRNLGGPGTPEAYQAAYADPASPDGLFPTTKVAGGYDFVGEVWPNGPLGFAGPLAPDPDPIDFEGHGTHVADIIGGKSQDGTHVGVAPGVSLYAFKVCSAVSSSCSGIAILQGLDASLDPNGDDDLGDAMDVVNLSLGSSYGQQADDSAYAVQVLTEYGVAVVASAGNSGDKPYVTGSPAVAPGAISVAQTTTPGAKAFVITATGTAVPSGSAQIVNTASLDWAPVNVPVSGPVVLGGLACGDYPVGTDFTGQVVLIDRGTCAVSVKVDRAAKLGAVGVIIANSVAGDPPSFSFGGSSDGNPFLPVPTLVITQDDGNLLKSWLSGGLTASFGPGSFTSLAGSIVSTSSRGPSFDLQTIKPDIGAPGASVSAEVGTATGETAFGGTSGAAPMVAGSAALVLQKYPALLPHEVKARLMNSAFTGVQNNPVTEPGVLAPITRIGAGEVRVLPALDLKAIAYDFQSQIPSLSFGYQPVLAQGQPAKVKRMVTIRNLGTSPQTFSATTSFRDPADAASGAVAVRCEPASVLVAPGAAVNVNVFLEIAPSKLPAWALDGGGNGGNGPLLSALEFDGHLTLQSAESTLTLPWHVLPRKAADLAVQEKSLLLNGNRSALQVRNDKGATDGTSELFALTGTSPVDYPVAPAPGSNQATPDLAAAGVRLAGTTLQFAVAMHNALTHPNYPAEFDVYLDVNGDGLEDFVAYTSELNGFAQTGQNVVTLLNLNTFSSVVRFYTDADLNASAAILSIRLSDLGVGPNQQIGYVVLAFDNYFTGAFTDIIPASGEWMKFTPSTPKFAVGSSMVSVAAGSDVKVPVTAPPGGAAASPGQSGVLAIHRNARPGAWWNTVPVSTK